MKSKIGAGLVWVVAVLVILTTTFACAKEAAPPAKPAGPDKVGMGFFGDLTGPVGFWNAPRIVGLQDALEYIWKEDGGIAGKEPFIDWFDTRSDPTIATSAYEKLVGKYLTNHSCGTGEQQLLKPRYDKDKFLTFTCSVNAGVVYPVGYAFASSNYLPDNFAAAIDRAAVEPPPPAAKGVHKVAYMGYATGFGRAALIDETKKYAADKGVEIVDCVIPFVPTEPTPLIKAREAGAVWCFTQAVPQSVPPLLKMNYENKYGLKFYGNGFCLDVALLKLSGPGGEGFEFHSNFPLPDEDTEGMKLVRKYWEQKFRAVEIRSSAYVLGWMNAYMSKFAIEETLQRLGGDWSKMNTREVRLTVEGWGQRNIKGLGEVNWTATCRAPTRGRLVRIEGGKWVLKSDWETLPHLVRPEWSKPWTD